MNKKILPLGLLPLLVISGLGAGQLKPASPEQVGMSSAQLDNIARVVKEEIEEKHLPGCVVIVARNSKIVYRQAFGFRALEPEEEPNSLDTIYDLASLTKPVATASSLLYLAQQGRLSLHDKVSQYIPEFKGEKKDDVKLSHLITHTSGLPAWDRYFLKFPQGNARKQVIEDICQKELKAAPGEKFIYSDLGFILLAEVVERVAKQGLDEFSRQNIFLPLGMKDTMFSPPEELHKRCAPTTRQENGSCLRGRVHDGNAWVQNGVSGHAGLFSTADDLAIFCQMLLNKGTYGEVRVFSPLVIEAMTTPQIDLAGVKRSFGWDISSSYSWVKGDFFPPDSFGHTGWTGTSIWISPPQDCFVIILSNRNHPTEDGSVRRLRMAISNIVAAAILE